MVHAERRALAAYFPTLRDEQWHAPTCCEKWNVQQLVGHLTAAAHVTAPHFFVGVIKTGFSFDKFVDGDLQQYAADSPAEVLARFQAVLDSNRKPPGPAYVALGEVMVHGETSIARSALAASTTRNTSQRSPTSTRRPARR